jgi:hypothetical protein
MKLDVLSRTPSGTRTITEWFLFPALITALENTPLLFPSDFFVRRAVMVSRAPGLDKDTPDDTHLQYVSAR